MKALRFSAFGPVSGLEYVDLHDPVADATTAIVRVLAGSINPSDVKNIEGQMEDVTVPRVPGRDYSGVVLHGPTEWIGAAVWGTGGEIGYTVDGSHGELIAVPVASLRRKPANLSFAEAAAVGTTYLAAWLAVIEYARLEAGETLVIIGAGGGVGSSAGQIGRWRGDRVVGVDRRALADDFPARSSFDGFFATENKEVKDVLREAAGSRGADVVFDTVGGVMFEPALSALGHRGRLVEISSLGDRRVSFDLLDFYHNESQLFDADTRKRNAIASGALLAELQPQFESGAFTAPRIDRIAPLSEGREAYEEIARGAPPRPSSAFTEPRRGFEKRQDLITAPRISRSAIKVDNLLRLHMQRVPAPCPRVRPGHSAYGRRICAAGTRLLHRAAASA
jgi:NADPH:quinone reductase